MEAKEALLINKIKKPGYSHDVKVKRKTKIKHISNKLINRLARHAGCPEDKTAGIYFHKKKDKELNKGEQHGRVAHHQHARLVELPLNRGLVGLALDQRGSQLPICQR